MRGRLVPRVPAPLRPDRSRRTTRRSSTGRSGRRDRDPARGLRPLRLLQPLVALRLDAGHVGRRARRHRRVPRRRASSSTSSTRSRRCGCRGRSRSMDWLLLLALRRRLADARADGDRAADGRGLVARGKEVIVVGAGDAAQLIVKEMLKSPVARLHADRPRRRRPAEEEPAPPRRPRARHDRRPAADPRASNRPDEVLIAIPSASGEVRQRIVDIARAAGIPVKTLPGHLRADLRRPRPRRPDPARSRSRTCSAASRSRSTSRAVASYLADETVLVTGAGGSIGSELCRQIARIGCKRLILVDQGETRALRDRARARLRARLRAERPGARRRRQPARACASVFERYTPAVVFHAAAYKHVPLMEANPLESVRNNTLATKVIAEVAVEFGVERFVLVSTDKAVNPKTVMGQSKALCEWIVEAYGARDGRPDALRRGALRQRARLVGQRDPDLPPPDRARRPGHGHPPGDDALLHDDPGGGLADRPGGVDRPVAARCSCSTWASRSRSSSWRKNMIRLSGKEPEPRHRDRVHRRPPRREAARGAVGRRGDRRRDPAPEDPAR